VLEAELGVLHWEEPGRARQPVEAVAGHRLLAEQLEEDLGAALPGAHHHDGVGAPQVLAVVEEPRGVQHVLAQRGGEGGRHVGPAAHAEHEVPAAHPLGAATSTSNSPGPSSQRTRSTLRPKRHEASRPATQRQ